MHVLASENDASTKNCACERKEETIDLHLVDRTSEDGSKSASDCSDGPTTDSLSEWDCPSDVKCAQRMRNKYEQTIYNPDSTGRKRYKDAPLSCMHKYSLLLPLFRVPYSESGIMWTGNFRRVPLFIFCHSNAMKTIQVDEELSRLFNLSFRLVRTECKLLRCILTTHGFRESDIPFGKFNLLWMGSHIRPSHMRLLSDFHRVNHFPKSYELTRKDRLAKNVQRMQRIYGSNHFDFVPASFILPGEFRELCSDYLQFNAAYIVKPIASSRGRGIFIVSHPNEIPYDEPVIVSRYISNPLLLDGFKFDVRLYAAVTSYEPLLVYIYEEGLVRFATVRYQAGSNHLTTQCMHLTNYSVNKRNFEFVQNDNSNVEDYGNKWSLGALLRYLRSEGVDVTGLMLRIEDIVIKSFLSVLQPMCSASAGFQPYRLRCFELYGFDIIVDENYRPWLLEVNLSPSLACDSPLDFKVKSHMLTDLLNLVGITCHDPGRKTQGGSNYSLHVAAAGNVIVPPQAPNCFIKAVNHVAAFTQPDPNTEQWTSSVHEDKSQSNVSSNLTAGLHSTDVSHLISARVTVGEVRLVQRLQEEAARAGGWIRLLPSLEVWDQYASVWPKDCLTVDPRSNEKTSFGRLNQSGSLFVKNKTIRNSLVESAYNASRASTILNNLTHSFLCHEGVALLDEHFYLHPNTSAGLVNLARYFHRDKEQCNTFLQPCHHKLPLFKSIKKTSMPLHSMPHSHLQQCLSGTIEPPCDASPTDDEIKHTTACYIHTLRHMPFYLRKLGSKPVRISGVELSAQCPGDPPIVGINKKHDQTSASVVMEQVPTQSTKPAIVPVNNSISKQTCQFQPTTPKKVDFVPESSNNSVSTVADKLSVVQARHLLATYLSKVLIRLRNEISSPSTDNLPLTNRKRSDQVDRLIRFILKASNSLTTGVASSIDQLGSSTAGGAGDVSWANLRIDPFRFHKQYSIAERKQILVRMLDRFIRLFQYETASLSAQHNADTKKPADCLNPTEFCRCVHQATEEELQNILARYAQLHCSNDLLIDFNTSEAETERFCQNSAQPYVVDSPTDSGGQFLSDLTATSTVATNLQIGAREFAVDSPCTVRKANRKPGLFTCCVRPRLDSPETDFDFECSTKNRDLIHNQSQGVTTPCVRSSAVELVLNSTSNEPNSQTFPLKGDVFVEKNDQFCQTTRQRVRKHVRRRRSQHKQTSKYHPVYSTRSTNSHRPRHKSSVKITLPPSQPMVRLLRVSSRRTTKTGSKSCPHRTSSKRAIRISHSIDSKKTSYEIQPMRPYVRKSRSRLSSNHRSSSSITSRKPSNLSSNNCCLSNLPFLVLHPAEHSSQFY